MYGQKRAFEIHFVHFNTKYPDSGSADMYPDGSIVVAVLFDWNNDTNDNPAFSPITRKLDEISDFKEEIFLNENFNLRGLLPKDVSTFYWYQGSLTTPPCSEELTWIVFPEVQEISYQQLKSFEFTLENEDNKVLGTTARSVQPLNNRTVKISSNKHCYDGLDGNRDNEEDNTISINIEDNDMKPIIIMVPKNYGNDNDNDNDGNNDNDNDGNNENENDGNSENENDGNNDNDNRR